MADLDGPGKMVSHGRDASLCTRRNSGEDAIALCRAAAAGSAHTRRSPRTWASVAKRCGAWVRAAEERRPGRGRRSGAGAEPGTDELARLRAENARLRGAEKEWQLEREILRRAAAYFAKEMK